MNRKCIKKDVIGGEMVLYKEIPPLQYAIKKIIKRIKHMYSNYSNEIVKFILSCKNIDVNQKYKFFKHRVSEYDNSYKDSYIVRWKRFDSDI